MPINQSMPPKMGKQGLQPLVFTVPVYYDSPARNQLSAVLLCYPALCKIDMVHQFHSASVLFHTENKQSTWRSQAMCTSVAICVLLYEYLPIAKMSVYLDSVVFLFDVYSGIISWQH